MISGERIYSVQCSVHHYIKTKQNKFDTQYINSKPLPLGTALTERVKVEKYQGHSSTHDIQEYFRLRGKTSWKSGAQITDLRRTERSCCYYGGYIKYRVNTLILFEFSNNREQLTVYVYSHGYYPSITEINLLVNVL